MTVLVDDYLKGKYTDPATGTVTDLGPQRRRFLQLDKPQTERRPKPVDLFASRTSRSVEQYVMDYPVSVVQKFGVVWETPSSFYAPLGWGGWEDPPSQADILQSKLRARIKSQNLNLAQSLAEYRQTSSMFVNLATDIVKTFRSLRSGRAIRDIVRYVDNPRNPVDLKLANRWLEYQYGLKPLMSDLYGAVDALATKIRTGIWLYLKTSSTDSTAGDYFNEYVTWPYYDRWTSKTNFHCVCRYKIGDESLKQLSQIGITNPLLLAWELIPYSFVIDWMIPVGDFLSSLDALAGVSALEVVNSEWNVRTVRREGVDGWTSRYEITSSRRGGTANSLSLPRLAYKPSTSFTAVANGAALLRQLREKNPIVYLRD